MKRMIKYYNIYQSDKAGFSDCSTEYEVLPELVDDKAGFEELKALAAKHGIKLGRKAIAGEERAKITHAINTMETKEKKGFGCSDKKEMLTVYVGFITLNEHGPL